MIQVWIIGSGKFGLRAARWMRGQKEPPMDVTLVDQDRLCLEKAAALGCTTVVGDGAEFLFKEMTRNRKPDWVVPAVPVHLAWEWCRLTLGTGRLVSHLLPEAIDACLPHPMRGTDNQIYVSHADFICPTNCSEPDDRCTVTGKPRKKDMFRLIAQLDFPGVVPFVIQSRQLGPGVGGYTPADLYALADRISRHTGPCLVATACRCHGVISGGFVKQGLGQLIKHQ
ncbi:MAG: NAD-binding protein [Thermodesulfobacteriota bacterium]